MGLVLNTTDWADSLWFNYYKSSPSVKPVVEKGKEKQSNFFSFTQDLHYKLYVDTEQTSNTKPNWASDLLKEAENCDEWSRLQAITRMDRLAAGVATEVVLQQLIDRVPQEEKQEKEDQNQDTSKTPQNAPQGVSFPGKGKGRGNQKESNTEHSGDSQSDSSSEFQSNDELRREIRKACRQAEKQVMQAKESMEGVEELMGTSAGKQCCDPVHEANSNSVEYYNKIKNNYKLKKIMDLVGRLRRCADKKQETTIRPATGQVYGIEQGDSINRLLPGELAMIANTKNKVLQYLAIERLLNKQSLQYALEGKEKSKRGDIIIFVDESSSMKDKYSGADTWAKAITLAIAITAKKERRSLQVFGFNGRISYSSKKFKNGDMSFRDIEEFVSRKPKGGTNFNYVIDKACTILNNNENKDKADVVVITDGDDHIGNDYIVKAKNLSKESGVSWFVLGVPGFYDIDWSKITNNISKITTYSDNTGNEVADLINLEV